jgi:hypothetical protein
VINFFFLKCPRPYHSSALSVVNSDHGETWPENGEISPHLSSLHPNEALMLKHMRPEIPSVRRRPKSMNKKTNFWTGKFYPNYQKKPF